MIPRCPARGPAHVPPVSPGRGLAAPASPGRYPGRRPVSGVLVVAPLVFRLVPPVSRLVSRLRPCRFVPSVSRPWPCGPAVAPGRVLAVSLWWPRWWPRRCLGLCPDWCLGPCPGRCPVSLFQPRWCHVLSCRCPGRCPVHALLSRPWPRWCPGHVPVGVCMQRRGRPASGSETSAPLSACTKHRWLRPATRELERLRDCLLVCVCDGGWGCIYHPFIPCVNSAC